MADLRVGGYWLDDFANVGGLTWSTMWQRTGPSGCWEASWSLDLDPTIAYPWLGRNALVEIYDGATAPWTGHMREPEKSADGWSCTAQGIIREAFNFPAVNNTGAPSTNPFIVVPVAISAGWNVSAAGVSVPSLEVSAQNTGELNTVGDVLNAYAEQTNIRYGAFADNRLFFRADANAPKWVVSPDVPLSGTADDDWYSRVVLSFFNSATTAVDRVSVENVAARNRWGSRGIAVDRTGLGPMTASKAVGIANMILANVAPRMGASQPLNLGALDLANLYDLPARTTQVQAGDMFRGQGSNDDQGNLTPAHTVDFVAGEVRYSAGDADASLYVAPLDLADRGFAKTLEAQAATEEQLKSKFKTGLTG